MLGLGYGMGPQKLQQTLKQGTMGPPVDISEEECRRIVQIYRQKNWKIKAFWKKMDAPRAETTAVSRSELRKGR